jgi:hypothetical protein
MSLNGFKIRRNARWLLRLTALQRTVKPSESTPLITISYENSPTIQISCYPRHNLYLWAGDIEELLVNNAAFLHRVPFTLYTPTTRG